MPRFGNNEPVEIRHADGHWYPGNVLAFTFHCGKRREELYFVEAKFLTGRSHKVQRLARDIRKFDCALAT